MNPLEIPLPNGTDVVVRRLPGDRLDASIADGIAGRVGGVLPDGSVQVTLIGGRQITVARPAVVPAKAGQFRFAARREATWSRLGPGASNGAIVLETIVGSRAWGLATESSDTDRRGLFAAPFSLRLGLVAPPQDLVSADGSASYWEIGKGIAQALRNDPNTLEMLFIPSARATDEIGAWILEERDAFPSKEMLGSFGRYALSQLRKLASTARLHSYREQLFYWLRTEPNLALDTAVERLASLAVTDGKATPQTANAATRTEAKERIKQLYRSLADRQVLPEATFAALRAFAQDPLAHARSEDSLGPALPAPFRPKNAYNLLRLMATAEHWLATGTPEFAFGGALHDRLFSIKRGEVPLDDVLAEATEKARAVEEAQRNSPLQARADVRRADALLRRCQEELLRRHAARVPGIFGADAPEPELPSVDAGGDEDDVEGNS